MSEKKSRLQRQAARARRSDVENELNEARGEIIRERDKALADAGKAYREGLEKLKADHDEARREAWARYDEERLRLIKEHAAKEQAA